MKNKQKIHQTLLRNWARCYQDHLNGTALNKMSWWINLITQGNFKLIQQYWFLPLCKHRQHCIPVKQNNEFILLRSSKETGPVWCYWSYSHLVWSGCENWCCIWTESNMHFLLLGCLSVQWKRVFCICCNKIQKRAEPFHKKKSWQQDFYG